MDKPYFQPGVSNWTIQADSFEAEIKTVLSETVTRYGNGYVRLNLEVAKIHPELEAALTYGKLKDATLVREWKAFYPNLVEGIVGSTMDMETMREAFEHIRVEKLQTWSKPKQTATFRIFAKKNEKGC